MTNSTLVKHFPENVIPRTICSNSTQRNFYTSTETIGTASSLVETSTSDRKGVWKVFLSQVFDGNTVDIYKIIS